MSEDSHKLDTRMAGNGEVVGEGEGFRLALQGQHLQARESDDVERIDDEDIEAVQKANASEQSEEDEVLVSETALRAKSKSRSVLEQTKSELHLEEFDIDLGLNLENVARDRELAMARTVDAATSEGQGQDDPHNFDANKTGKEIIWWAGNCNVRLPKTELICNNCEGRGHSAQDCTKIETDGIWKGYVKVCPFCATSSHIFAECKRLRIWLGDLWHFFVIKRNGKPPIPCPWHLWEIDSPKWVGKDESKRPQTPAFAFRRWKETEMMQPVDELVRDPTWDERTTESMIFAHDYHEVFAPMFMVSRGTRRPLPLKKSGATQEPSQNKPPKKLEDKSAEGPEEVKETKEETQKRKKREMEKARKARRRAQKAEARLVEGGAANADAGQQLQQGNTEQPPAGELATRPKPEPPAMGMRASTPGIGRGAGVPNAPKGPKAERFSPWSKNAYWTTPAVKSEERPPKPNLKRPLSPTESTFSSSHVAKKSRLDTDELMRMFDVTLAANVAGQLARSQFETALRSLPQSSDAGDDQPAGESAGQSDNAHQRQPSFAVGDRRPEDTREHGRGRGWGRGWGRGGGGDRGGGRGGFLPGGRRPDGAGRS